MVPVYVFFAALALLMAYFAVVYNQFVRLRNRIDNQWSDVNILLKRRADLIPNLVSTVQGYAGHERGTLEAVTRARAATERAQSVGEQAHAETALSSALGRLIAVSEAYPQLQAQQGFQDLREQLAQTENQIFASRHLYNDTVLAYENARETIPTNVVAWFLGFGPREFFAVDDVDLENPNVEFGSAATAPTA